MALVGGGCDSNSSLPSTSAPLDPTDNAGASGGAGASTSLAGGSSNSNELDGSGGISVTGTGNAPSTGAGGSNSGGNADSGDATPGVEPSGTLRFDFVDSEGGQSTVVQLPNGQNLVIDTGNPGMRDGERMLAVLQGELGASRIDYLLTRTTTPTTSAESSTSPPA